MKKILNVVLIPLITMGATSSFAFDMSSPVNSLVVDTQGEVGVGTATPSTTLHVKKENAVLKVEDTNTTTAVRTVVQLKNQGAVGFSMEDISKPVTWDFRTNGSGNFIMNDVGDGAEVTVLRSGNMILSGTLAEGSSREIKTDIGVIDSKDFMEKVSQVDVLEWRYKGAEKKDRHIGPMAEDFYKLFPLGTDNKHINPRDVASIALLAAKELQKKADITSNKLETSSAMLEKRLDTETAQLKAENEVLKKRLASLEKLVTSLASADVGSKAKTKQVAMNTK